MRKVDCIGPEGCVQFEEAQRKANVIIVSEEALCGDTSSSIRVRIGFKSQLHHILAMRLWASTMAFQHLCFLTYKMGIIIVSPSQSCYEH